MRDRHLGAKFTKTLVLNPEVNSMSDKKRLQAVLARRALPLPVYGSLGQDGRLFEEHVKVHLADDVVLTSTGRATTRRAAQETAANTMLQQPIIMQLAAGGMQTPHKDDLQESVMRPNSPWMNRMPAYASLAVNAAGFNERVTIWDKAGQPFTAVGTALTREAAQQNAARQLLMAVA